MYLKRLTTGCVIAGILYWAYHISSPSISLLNSSDSEIIQASISLSDNKLSFGALEDGEDKELSYSLLSGSGEYTYYFRLSNNIVLTGKCGNFKSFEISKRVIFLVSDKKVISQNSNGEPLNCESSQV